MQPKSHQQVYDTLLELYLRADDIDKGIYPLSFMLTFLGVTQLSSEMNKRIVRWPSLISYLLGSPTFFIFLPFDFS